MIVREVVIGDRIFLEVVPDLDDEEQETEEAQGTELRIVDMVPDAWSEA